MLNFRERFVFIFFASMLLFSNATVFANKSLEINQISQQKKNISHVVKVGDTAYSIASKYGISLEEIYNNNPGTRNGIRVGQTLKITNYDEPTEIKQNVNPAVSRDVNSSLYEVKNSETLYSISKKNNCTVDEILNLNIGLNPSSLKSGMIIKVPSIKQNVNDKGGVSEDIKSDINPSSFAIEHHVEPQETLYSISKRYNCSVDEIRALNKKIIGTTIQEGDTIYIPYFDSKSTPDYAQKSPGEFPTYLNPNDNVIRVAILLPFTQGSKNVSVDKIIEYYEGFLIAIKDLKKKGLNAEVYTFNIGGDDDITRLNNILTTNELNKLDLIVGGVSDNQIRAISNFTKRAPDVRYIVPFSNKNTGVGVNPNMFQVANSHSNQFDYISKAFATKYSFANIVFISDKSTKNDKLTFTDDLQKQLQLSNVNFRVAPSTASITDDLSTVMTKGKQNVVVPTFTSQAGLIRLLDAISYLKRKGYDISLFGYPEWQSYVNLDTKFHECNTTIYSSFFLVNNSQTTEFAQEFKYWYHKSFINATPKYAYMGYDTGYYFLSAYLKYGAKYPQYIESYRVESLQTAFTFAKVNKDGGYVNVGLYFVTYSPDKKITRVVVR